MALLLYLQAFKLHPLEYISCTIFWLFLCSKHYAIINHTCNLTPQSIVFSFKIRSAIIVTANMQFVN